MKLNNTYCAAGNLTAEESLERLQKGNERYMFDHMEHPHEGAQRRLDLSTAQHPFAVILGCGDSRVVPELIFDQGVGDLFVLRIAGAIADDAVIASIEYAIEHLGTRLVVVMGHEKCGAVTAAIAHASSEGKINSLLSYIEPSINAVLYDSGDLLSNAIKAHVKQTVQTIQQAEPILSHESKSDNVLILPAYYNLSTGRVNFLETRVRSTVSSHISTYI